MITTGGVALASIGVFGGSGAASEHNQETTTLAEGTEYETEAFINESGQAGPTAVIVGGMHGHETAGYEAAHRITDWSFNCGTLVVLPEANAPAIEQSTREGPDGDLNRQFPTSQTPDEPIAAEIWDVITEHDADLVMDLHSSQGIWQSGSGGGTGQAIFPSAAGDSRAIADEVTAAMNENHVDDSFSSDHDFVVGNDLTGERPLLIHKVAGDLEQPGYLTEVTRYDTDLDTRIEWTKTMVAKLLSHHGIETDWSRRKIVQSSPPLTVTDILHRIFL